MKVDSDISTRFDYFLKLSGNDAVFDDLKSSLYTFEKNEIVFREGEPSNSILCVARGACFSYRDLKDGSRQVLDLFFPGEVIGLAECGMARRRNGLITLDTTEFLVYPKREFTDIFSSSPILANLMVQLISREQAVLLERMIGLGRRSAKQKLAHFLLEIRYRMKRGNPSRSGDNVLFFPQIVIADALGLSAVHVCRTLHYLSDQGLISRSGLGIKLNNIEGLEEIAGWSPRQFEEELAESAA